MDLKAVTSKTSESYGGEQTLEGELSRKAKLCGGRWNPKLQVRADCILV